MSKLAKLTLRTSHSRNSFKKLWCTLLRIISNRRTSGNSYNQDRITPKFDIQCSALEHFNLCSLCPSSQIVAIRGRNAFRCKVDLESYSIGRNGNGLPQSVTPFLFQVLWEFQCQERGSSHFIEKICGHYWINIAQGVPKVNTFFHLPVILFVGSGASSPFR